MICSFHYISVLLNDLQNNDGSRGGEPPPKNAEGMRQRPRGGSDQKEKVENKENEPADYTQEQLQLVKRSVSSNER